MSHESHVKKMSHVNHDESLDESYGKSHDGSHEPTPPPLNHDHTPTDRTGDDSQTHQKLFRQEGEAAGKDFVP